jgi:hypothetical protein
VPFIVMQYVTGGDVRPLVRRAGRLSWGLSDGDRVLGDVGPGSRAWRGDMGYRKETWPAWRVTGLRLPRSAPCLAAAVRALAPSGAATALPAQVIWHQIRQARKSLLSSAKPLRSR